MHSTLHQGTPAAVGHLLRSPSSWRVRRWLGCMNMHPVHIEIYLYTRSDMGLTSLFWLADGEEPGHLALNPETVTAAFVGIVHSTASPSSTSNAWFAFPEVGVLNTMPFLFSPLESDSPLKSSHCINAHKQNCMIIRSGDDSWIYIWKSGLACSK